MPSLKQFIDEAAFSIAHASDCCPNGVISITATIAEDAEKPYYAYVFPADGAVQCRLDEMPSDTSKNYIAGGQVGLWAGLSNCAFMGDTGHAAYFSCYSYRGQAVHVYPPRGVRFRITFFYTRAAWIKAGKPADNLS